MLEIYVDFASETFMGMGSCDDCSRYVVWSIRNLKNNKFENKNDLFMDYNFLYYENDILKRIPNNGHSSQILKLKLLKEIYTYNSFVISVKKFLTLYKYIHISIYDRNDDNYSKHNHCFVLLNNNTIIDSYLTRPCEIRTFNWNLLKSYMKTRDNIYWDELFNFKTQTDTIIDLIIEISI